MLISGPRRKVALLASANADFSCRLMLVSRASVNGSSLSWADAEQTNGSGGALELRRQHPERGSQRYNCGSAANLIVPTVPTKSNPLVAKLFGYIDIFIVGRISTALLLASFCYLHRATAKMAFMASALAVDKVGFFHSNPIFLTPHPGVAGNE